VRGVDNAGSARPSHNGTGLNGAKRNGLSNDHVEPHDIGNYANPEYYWRYDSPEVQQLVGDAKVAPTRAEATELLKQAARQISEDSPVDWLLLGADLTVAHQGVTGFPLNDTASRFDASGITVAG